MRATQHAWRAGFILLSELTVPADFELAAGLSFRDTAAGPPRLDAAPEACNVIVGADRGFRTALDVGAQAVAEHLAGIEARLRARWRAQIDTTELEL
jgi:hypothetical protein